MLFKSLLRKIIINIDYSAYSLSELNETLESIDSHKYPENYKRIKDELAKPNRNKPKSAQQIVIAENNTKKTSKALLCIVLGLFILLRSYFNYESGVIYKRYNEPAVASLESNPKKFYLFLFFTIGAGGFITAYGIHALFSKKEDNDKQT